MTSTAPALSPLEQLVPTFSLYGEQQWPTPDLLHWESVARRSALHNWVIKPHRHSNLWQAIYLAHGRAKAHIDGREQELTLPCLLAIPQLCVHGFEFSADIDGHVVTLAAPLIQTINNNLNEVESLLEMSSILTVSDADARHLQNLLENLASEYQQQGAYRDFALQALVSQLVLWVVRRENRLGNKQQHISTGKQYFSQFMQLVEQHFRQHRPLEDYAETIGISKPHLNSICRQYADRSALQLIHQRLLLEAKRNLIYTVMNVSEISNALGFSEPPYFTRFFKRMTGSSPVEFRKQH